MSGYSRTSGAPFSEHTTSRIAADLLSPEAVRSQCERLRQYLIICGDRGTTCEEAEGPLRFPHETASPRMRELEFQGWAVKTGRKRLGRKNKPHDVYVLGNGIPPDIPKRVLKKNIDWKTKPLGKLDYKILLTMLVQPKRCKQMEHMLWPEHEHEAISGNLTHLVERDLVEFHAYGVNLDTRKPAKIWRLTKGGYAALKRHSIKHFLNR